MESDNSEQFKATAVHQIGILVKEDPEELAKEWERLFGIGPWRIIEISPKVDGGTLRMFKLALVDLNGVELELAQPLDAQTYHKEHVEAHGNTGLHHICFPVADVASETEKFKAKGGIVLADMAPGCSYIQFPNAGNVIIELVPKR